MSRIADRYYPTLYRWFARSAARRPHAIALEISGRTLTYLELRRRAEALSARVLREHGRPPSRVALLANRTVAGFTGYLAALRLGAAVVPLNPGHPAEHNKMINELARPDVLLADAVGQHALEEGLGGGVPSVLLMTGADQPASRDEKLPPCPAVPDRAAYIVFIPGPTGRPKGVPITHRNLAPFIAHNISRFAVRPGCRMSHTFDLTSDASVFDLFVTWGGGATLVCPERADLLTPVQYVSDRGITHWFSAPSMVSVNASLGRLPYGKPPSGRPSALRHIIFIGEQLTYREAMAWREVAPAAAIDNVYGLTELTVACAEYRLPLDPRRWPATSNDTVPIGTVYDFLDYALLDDAGQRAHDGELCVRGDQRFGGYLDPDDNQGSFVGSPGSGRSGLVHPRLFYRTGDRVRWEGEHLVHLGRSHSA